MRLWANGSDQSNLVRALTLIVAAARGDLMACLARLIRSISQRTQVWVITHSPRLNDALADGDGCHRVYLERELWDPQKFLNRPCWNAVPGAGLPDAAHATTDPTQ